ncbi:ATP-dependent helicase [Magnetospira sp. QH-2]|uniref:ATP-dependent helicase n=1 Tax=Magnetospira sp. (strain QH-2) TaxID=1288970 RepID=UPI0003E80AA5|nr:UvrD-helicase domain-containing protein [Magnetospira sp. QH-2]CCQ74978.1 DNA helicase II [Magnetospira sp. QH-2]
MTDPFDFTDDDPPAAAAPAPRPEPPFLRGLNDAQFEAVESLDGPVLVLAGAGTGKTRVLTTRLANILARGRARPYEMLAVTFTNKAAREMRDRVAALLGTPVEGWWVGTFHALGARILRNHAEAAGLRPNFTILDDDDQVRLIKQVLELHPVDDKRWPARVLLGAIQRWKDRGLTPDQVSDAEGADLAEGRLVAIYKDYQQRLTDINAADFGDLLLLNLTLFQTKPDILKRYQQQFRYLLVDEYQDTNIAQYLWLRLLAQGHRNICCVGDDDQSIYSWRGAEVGNILRFEEDFPGAAVIRLERNYRSTSHILGAASGLITHNDGRLGKTLWTEESTGEKVRVVSVWDGATEARRIGRDIEDLHRQGHSLEQMAVLVRAGFQTREFEERLITLGIPYRVIGGPRFYERQEIRDALAYLRVIVQPDDDLAFERIVNLPKRGIGKAVMQTLHTHGRARRRSLHQVTLDLIDTDELRPKVRQTLRGLMEDFERWRHQAAAIPHPELMGQVLDESGYTEMWKISNKPDGPGRLDNLKELVSGMEQFENLAEFLEHVSLVMENDSRDDTEKVSLMTLHGAKGLEFDTVFLPGWEEGLFPHQRALDDGGMNGLEEERRLAYVGLTRARQRARISHAANRRIYNQWQSSLPSRFIEELPETHVDFNDETVQAQSRQFGFSDSWSRQSHGGFDSARQRRRRDPLVIEAQAQTTVETAPTQSSRYAPGDRVRHRKFGEGTVVSAEGEKLVIDFGGSGTKKVVDSFVERA